MRAPGEHSAEGSALRPQRTRPSLPFIPSLLCSRFAPDWPRVLCFKKESREVAVDSLDKQVYVEERVS